MRNPDGKIPKYTFVCSDDDKSPESKNENDLNTSNKSKEDNEAEKPKATKASNDGHDDKKSQDNQTPKEQVRSMSFTFEL